MFVCVWTWLNSSNSDNSRVDREKEDSATTSRIVQMSVGCDFSAYGGRGDEVSHWNRNDNNLDADLT